MSSARRSLILSMLIFGTIGIFREYIPLPSGTLAMLRGFIGAFFLLGLTAVRRQKPDWSCLRSRGVALVISGGLIGLNWILLFEAYRYTTLAVATLCYYMAPMIVILLSPLVLREKLTGRKALCVLVALVGAVLVSGVIPVGQPAPAEAAEAAQTAGKNDLTGVLLGLGAAALYACVILMNKRLADVGAQDRTIVQLGSAGVTLLPYVLLLPGEATGPVTLPVILLVAVVGIIHTGVAYMLYFGGMSRLPAQTVALYSYIDPITAILLSLLILHDPMSWVQAVGAVMILGAALMSDMKG